MMDSTQTTTPPPRSGSFAKIIAVVVIVLLAAGGGFFAGMQFGGSSSTRSTADAANGPEGMGRGSMMGRGGFGTVTEVSDSSITIQAGMRRSSQSSSGESTTKTYKITTSTKITNNGETVAASTLKSGDRVMIQTDENDTSTATAIEVNPQMRGPGMGSSSQQSEGSDSSSGSSS